MTDQVEHTRAKTLAANIIAIATMITVMSASISISERSVNAQMMGDHVGGWAGNTTSGQQQQQHEQKMINNGTINLEKLSSKQLNLKLIHL